MQNLRKFISVLLVIGLLCSFNSSASAANCSLPRIYGGNRYETAVEVSRAGWEQAEVVVLARGDDFADALAGVPLAYANDAPILLTRPNRLVAAAEAEIKRLGASKVFILGGLGAISVEVEEQLVGMGLAVERINGKNRYETAANIAGHESLLGATTAVLAYGKDFPDGLAAASYAARQGYPILLTDINRLPESSRAALEGKDVIVVGGEAVVGQAVIDQLGGEVTRISGPNRAATSVELARFFQPGGSKMYIATGSDFADALTGAVLAAKEDSGLLLVTTFVSGVVQDYVKEREPELTILGGEGAVSREVEERLYNILNYVGEKVEFIRPSALALTPGGAAVRFPYRGHVTTVLDATEEYFKIQFGSKRGWVPRADVVRTERDADFIRMTWNFTSASDFVPEPPNASGYNVYAPISHSVSPGSNGTYSLGVHTGINSSIPTARSNGYLVWMTVQQFGKDSNMSNALIQDLIAEAQRLNVDGINIDFENLGLENRDSFTDFMDKLATQTAKKGLALSVDVTKHAAGSSWSVCYDRAALGRICDYVILMAYDQYPAGSSVPGPVASHPWTRDAVNRLLAEVPAERIILGVPFYNRVWIQERVAADRDYVRATGSAVAVRTEPTTAGGSATVIRRVDGSVLLAYVETVTGENINGNPNWHKVDLGAEGTGYISAYYSEIIPAGTVLAQSTRSSHYSYRIIKAMVDNFDQETKTSFWTTLGGAVNHMTEVSIVYNSASEQNILTYINDEGMQCTIWLEDVMSLQKRLALTLEKGLAGMAAWSINWMDGERQLWNSILEE
jgi:putative cell wall-binding protein/spore germination protein YaaH